MRLPAQKAEMGYEDMLTFADVMLCLSLLSMVDTPIYEVMSAIKPEGPHQEGTDGFVRQR